ncbi:MAG: murein transglycosylase domain-containing protein, partial [Gammaproteobacteria bacterium]
MIPRPPFPFKFLLLLALILAGCTVTDIQRAGKIITADDPGKAAARVVEDKAMYVAANPHHLPAEIRALKARIEQFRNIVETIWGEEEARQPTPKEYVKYTDEYYSRAYVDFEAGRVAVETVAPESQRQHLKQAIVTTLLTPDDPREVDMYSAAAPGSSSRPPFLYEQVLDQDGKPIRWEWRAGRYADYLIANKLERISIGGREGLRVVFPLIPSHENVRAYKYAALVKKYSRQYNVTESL